MIYGIPSYKRPECRTAQMLLDAGVNAKDIVISVQTEQDFKEYSSKWANFINIVYQPKDCAAGNRNTLLDYIRQPFLLLDDDIRCFSECKGNTFLKDNQSFLSSLQGLFDFATEQQAPVFGISPTDSNLISVKRGWYSTNCLLQGTVLGIIDCSLRFNSKYKMVEDYELSLRVMRNKKTTLRFNRFCANKPSNGSNQGGMYDRYANGELKYWLGVLATEYPNFKPNKTMTGGNIVYAKRKQTN